MNIYRSIYKFPEVANLEKQQVNALLKEIRIPIPTVIIFWATIIAAYWSAGIFSSYIYGETHTRWLAIFIPSASLGVYVYAFLLLHINTYVRKEIRRRVTNYT